MRKVGYAFAPINIALVKYWGKRNSELNLPQTSSLSLSLGEKGAAVEISCCDSNRDLIAVNDKELSPGSSSYQAISDYLALFRGKKGGFQLVKIVTNIPVAAGFASSAAIYAALVKALKDRYRWQLSAKELSILARLGSGSACRSMWNGFVKWQKGTQSDGMDCHGVPISMIWPELRIGLLVIDEQQKPISSREAMQRTVATSPLYKKWSQQVAQELRVVEKALREKKFTIFAAAAERNALAMHAMMAQAAPPINYSLPSTLAAYDEITRLRQEGDEIYFTQDAGPNLKLLFLEQDSQLVRSVFPEIEIVAPFADPMKEQVVLVDANDKSIGVAEKLGAHQKGLLHRAFSVLIYRKRNNSIEVLLQQRNSDKYHCGGLWANSCCSHPRPSEDVVSAAQRRLREELDFTAHLLPIGTFQYQAEFTNGLIEHEVDHVIIASSEQEKFTPNKKEVQELKWVSLPELESELITTPGKYVPWLKSVMDMFKHKRGAI